MADDNFYASMAAHARTAKESNDKAQRARDEVWRRKFNFPRARLSDAEVDEFFAVYPEWARWCGARPDDPPEIAAKYAVGGCACIGCCNRWLYFEEFKAWEKRQRNAGDVGGK